MIQEKICPSCNESFISKRKDSFTCSRICYINSKHNRKIYPARGIIKKDLTGKKFGRLLVLKFIDFKIYNDKHSTRRSRWLCKCDCNNKLIIRGDALQSGNTISCGCYNREKTIKNNKKRKLPDNLVHGNNIFSKYKWEAKKRNYIWNLTKEQFIKLIENNCHYCNKEPTATDKRYNYKYNGIDRINNDIGYEIDNCVSCCKNCNHMKLTQTYQEFIISCITIANFHKGKLNV